MNRRVTVNEKGYRVGEDHHNAKLTQHEIELMLQIRGEGLSYRRIAEIFEISKSGVCQICNGLVRGQTTVMLRRTGKSTK